MTHPVLDSLRWGRMSLSDARTSIDYFTQPGVQTAGYHTLTILKHPDGKLYARQNHRQPWAVWKPPMAPTIDSVEDEEERQLAQALSDVLFHAPNKLRIDPLKLLKTVQDAGWIPESDLYKIEMYRRDDLQYIKELEARIGVLEREADIRFQKERKRGFDEANSKAPAGLIKVDPSGRYYVQWSAYGGARPLGRPLPEPSKTPTKGVVEAVERFVPSKYIPSAPISWWTTFSVGGVVMSSSKTRMMKSLTYYGGPTMSKSYYVSPRKF